MADRWFLETVVRLHRAGEGAPFTGLKPAGLDVGPVIPVAERAIEDADPAELADLLAGIVRTEVERRFHEVMDRRKAAIGGDLAAARRYVSSMLGLQVWSHSLAAAAHGDPHEHHD